MAVTISPPPPRKSAEQDEFEHRATDPAQRGAEQEQQDRGLQHDLATEQISKLAVQGGDDRRRKQVGGNDPGEVREPAKFANDGRQRRRHDRLVE